MDELIYSAEITPRMLRHYFMPGSVVSISGSWYRVLEFTVYDPELVRFDDNNWTVLLAPYINGKVYREVSCCKWNKLPTFADFIETYKRIRGLK